MSQRTVPSTFDVLATMIRVTLLRLFRGRAVWVCVGISFLPLIVAGALGSRHNIVEEFLSAVEMLVVVVLPPVFVASSIGEEIEDRTTTYLWSRPIPRWAVVVGKLVALAPIAIVHVLVGWFVSVQAAIGRPPSAESLIAFGGGALAISVMSAGIATLVPKQGMALAMLYLVLIDVPIGLVPASLQAISITRQILVLAGFTSDPNKLAAAISMTLLAGIWFAVGLLRLRRRES
ncbi:MAG: ABC transporter permease subunit [Kofleriaceae bacterium]|nr:ABC transporter permease subunit [Kofleriaceae bacterium]